MSSTMELYRKLVDENLYYDNPRLKDYHLKTIRNSYSFSVSRSYIKNFGIYEHIIKNYKFIDNPFAYNVEFEAKFVDLFCDEKIPTTFIMSTMGVGFNVKIHSTPTLMKSLVKDREKIFTMTEDEFLVWRLTV